MYIQCIALKTAGFPMAYPVFHIYLSSGDAARHPDSIVLALLSPGLMYLQEGLIYQVLPRSTRYYQFLVVTGIFLIILGMILASYSRVPWQIVCTQGFMFGMGGVLLNYVHVSVFPEWFDKKQGQAMGLIWLGYRVGALAFPVVCQWLLVKHGFEETLRVLIAPMLALLLPCIFLLRGRYTAATVTSAPVQSSVSKLTALRTPKVVFYLVTSIFFDFVMSIPRLFIMSFAADLKLKASDQALALVILVLSDMLPTYILSALSDSSSYVGLMVGCAISTSIVHFVMWGLAKNQLSLYAYAAAVGLTSGGRFSIFI